MALHNITQGFSAPYQGADTFADIPFDPVTGNFNSTGYLPGQQFVTLDDLNRYEVTPNGSGTLLLTSMAGNMSLAVAGASLGRGLFVAQDAVSGKWLLQDNPAGDDKPAMGLTLRAQTINLTTPILIGGFGLAIVANGITVNPGAKLSADASGKATTAGLTNVVAVSIDSAPRIGNVGGTVLALVRLIPSGV